MGRKPKENITDENTQAMELVAQSAQNALQRKEEINAYFLEEGETYNINACLEKAKVYQEQMASGMLGLGAQLLLLKANEEHGCFLAAVEELGLSDRSADYAMCAALKFGVSSPAVATLGNSKIRALTVLDDDDSKDLVNGNSIEGLGNLDDVARMTVKELKEKLRQLRDEKTKIQEEHAKQLEAVEEVVRKKESKISELEMEVAGKQPPTKEELAEQELKDVRKQMIIRFSEMNTPLDELNALLDKAQTLDGVTVDLLQSLSDGVAEFYSLFDDKYQDFNQDMENIRPLKKEA